jgi:hypothetical protein
MLYIIALCMSVARRLKLMGRATASGTIMDWAWIIKYWLGPASSLSSPLSASFLELPPTDIIGK